MKAAASGVVSGETLFRTEGYRKDGRLTFNNAVLSQCRLSTSGALLLRSSWEQVCEGHLKRFVAAVKAMPRSVAQGRQRGLRSESPCPR